MKTMAFALMILTAASAAQAHSAQHHGAYSASHADSFVGLQPNRSLADTPRLDRKGCNGGACTLSGGPSGGPNQT